MDDECDSEGEILIHIYIFYFKNVQNAATVLELHNMSCLSVKVKIIIKDRHD